MRYHRTIANGKQDSVGTFLNPDNTMFQMMLNSIFYVDRTAIATFMNNRICKDGRFVAVSRPRRFGKSVDADMLVAYYSKGCDSRSQFVGLSVAQDPSFERHLNAHDVIKVNVQNLVRPAGGIGGIESYLSRSLVKELRGAWPDAVAAGTDYLPDALESVRQAKGSGFVFVIDEWDCPFRIDPNDTIAQHDYLDFLRDLLKDRAYADACYMTGILPIKKYGRHSALNLFAEYSMTDAKDLESLFGFTSNEVRQLCERFDMSLPAMERWYDGYILGPSRLHAYNPNSIACAIRSRHFSSYWTQTETYEALQAYLDMDFDGVAAELVAMLDGQKVPAQLDAFENDMRTFASKDDVYALLVHLGYLGYDQVERTVFIPNEEIRREFATSLREGARPQLARLIRNSRELQRRTIDGDEAYVAEALRIAHNSAAAPQHYNDEQALRAAVKLAYIWSIDDYLRVDELPGGRGYADLAFLPKPGSALPPMIVELKWDKPVDAAITQAHRRNYPEALRELSGECMLAGITYHEADDAHECRIERISLSA